MIKRNFLLLLTLFFLLMICTSCGGDSTVTSTAVSGSVLELGYEIDENLEVVAAQTNFKAGEDFYFSFFNNEPFGGNSVTVQLIESSSDEILADGVYEVDPEWDTIADMIWFSDPGKYKVVIKVGEQTRATQEVIIE
ncbi:MAG: hypothetical protein SCJ97_08340 [Bacillota bacterium]|nr:hypothetical protein [Bacillota bacterium]